MIIFLSFQYLVPFIRREIPDIWGSIVCTVIIIALLSPFLRAIMIKKNHSIEFEKLWNDSKVNRGPLLFLIIFRTIICTALVMFVVAGLLNPTFGVTLTIALSVITVFIFSKGLKKQSIRIERRFKTNLNARQWYLEQNAPIRQGFANHLFSRDLHLAEFDVKPYYSMVGETLKELNFYQLYGVNVVTIIRNKKRINIPRGSDRIFPYDTLIVLGTDKQMIRFQRYIEDRKSHETEQPSNDSAVVTIEQFQIESNSIFIGKTIKDSGMRDKADCLVVGIERGEASIMNPDINIPFMEGDIVWVVGEREKIQHLSNHQYN
jgi:CPA2 family monovalent cation:H+ antiporter-2